jgi:hypothetical protein
MRREKQQWLQDQLALACKQKSTLTVLALLEFTDVYHCSHCNTAANYHTDLWWMVSDIAKAYAKNPWSRRSHIF